MVTFEERLHAVRRQIVLGVHSLGSVASAADVGRNLQRRTARQRHDFVLGMAISAGGRLTMTGGYRFAMNAFGDVFRCVRMATTARLGELRPVQRRIRRGWRQNGMAVMAIAAGGRGSLALGNRQPVDARAITLRLLFVTARAIDGLCGNIVVRMLHGYVRVATGAGVRFVNGGRELRDIHKKRDLAA